jgi:predicted 3-demethylubiquinone-9 3-methyltransferase (glyoxalase superfamily)
LINTVAKACTGYYSKNTPTKKEERNIHMRKIVTFFWFNDQAKEAVDLYVSLFENAKIINTSYLTESVAKVAGKKAGDVSSIDFELNGQNFTALNGGPMYTFSEAMSIAVNCKTQEEIDKLWEALSKGGEIMSCGWLKDKYGLTWQIMPESLDIMMRDPDSAKAVRVGAAMLNMEGKLNISDLEKAYKGE